MISEMVSVGLPSELLTDGDLFPSPTEKEHIADLTDKFYSKLFRPIPKGKGQIVFISSLLIGWQGSGKSDTIAYDAWKCCQTYGTENVEIIRTNSYKVVLEKISGRRPVVFAIVDDAMRCQNSRKSMSSDNADLVADYNETRHVFEKRSQGMIANAVIIVETAVQRWHGLDITLRSSSELIRFKTGETDKHDRDTIRDYLGPEGLFHLDRIWSWSQSNPKFKSLSVGRIANEQPPMGVGLCWNGFMPSVDPSFVLPPLIEHRSEDEPEPPRTETPLTEEDPTERLRNDPKWSYKFECYSMCSEGIPQSKVREILKRTRGISVSKTTVSDWINQVRRELGEPVPQRERRRDEVTR